MLRQALNPSFPAMIPTAEPTTLSVDEAHQLSRILARLGVFDETNKLRRHDDVPGTLPRESHQSPLVKARAIYDTRQLRRRFFPKTLFSEPGWEILLVLYIYDGVARLCIRDVAQLVNTPNTTLLRWLDVLQDEKLIQLEKHHLDRRVTNLAITDLGRSNFEAFLACGGD